ncbi:SpoIID/LytB domain-containing protein, partial [Myxococcota bacterium]|nr:SpoIID/LytB domain-containing protein [Myxococcota bacterium]
MVLAWSGAFAATAARAGSAPAVRVLLAESAEPVSIAGDARSQRVALAGAAGGLVVDGQPVGATWSPRGDGPWQVSGRRYRGRLELRASPGRILVVNHVELEDYVAATVGGEMPASWPEQALRAQAVATRTYALHQRDRRRAEPWDVRATEQSQVYHGLESEAPPTR